MKEASVNHTNAKLYSSTTLFVILVVTALIHITSLALSKGAFSDFRWEHLPIHASVEMLGAAIAFWVAWTLISVNRSNDGTSYNLRIAAALIAMGMLDGLHAVWHVGNEFVWLHSLATLFGGAAFASIFINIKLPVSNLVLMSLFIALVLIVGLWPYWAPHTVPQMTNSNGFTFYAKALNISGGVLFILAGIKLLLAYQKTKKVDDFLFFLHCVLFGSAAIMFEQSKLWDFAWWGWHLLRLMAYAVALIFIIQTELRIQRNFITRLENEVSQRTEELTEANKRLERFASMASHDLKEPLRMISSFSQILSTKLADQLDDNDKKHLQFVIDGSNQGLTLVDDILNLSKSSHIDDSIESLRFSDILDRVKLNNARLIKEKGAIIELRNEPPELCGNASQLYQICSNLINNGIKYNDSETPRIVITISEGPNAWTVDFEDNGIGIDEQHHTAIFNEFNRLHSKDKYQGTGLGLATCLALVKRSGGDIKVSSTVGKGSTFSLSWPKILSCQKN